MKPKHRKPTRAEVRKGELVIASFEVEKAKKRMVEASVDFVAACAALCEAVQKKIELVIEE